VNASDPQLELSLEY